MPSRQRIAGRLRAVSRGRHTFAQGPRGGRFQPTPQPHLPVTPHPPDQSLMALLILCALALLCAWTVNTLIQLLR